MINTPTVLILGAGASMPYGFPSGGALRDSLCGLFQDSVRRSIFESLGFSQHDLKVFCVNFRESGIPSIDEFLYYRGQDFGELGKYAIAAEIISLERPGGVFLSSKEQGNWYEFLWTSLRGTWDDFAENKLRIVTFNYDRSLEYYLARALSVTFKRTLESCIEHLRHLKITHVYGQVGLLGEQNPVAGRRSYSTSLDSETLRIATKIRLMQERQELTETSQQIEDTMRWAEKVCFLGFAYDRRNLEQLALGALFAEDAQRRPPKMFGTTMGLSPQQISAAITTLRAAQHLHAFQEIDSLSLLRRFNILSD